MVENEEKKLDEFNSELSNNPEGENSPKREERRDIFDEEEKENKEVKEKVENKEKKKNVKKAVKKKAKKEEPEEEMWEDLEGEEGEKSSVWMYVAGIAIVLLIISVLTQGFGIGGVTGAAVKEEISLEEAEERAIGFINANLLGPGVEATLAGKEELDDLYKFTLMVMGREIESYMTKDGGLFFPQGIRLEEVELRPEMPEPREVEVSADDDAFLGPEEAEVVVIVFSDFECPYCGAAAGFHEGLMERFKGQDPSWEAAMPGLKGLAKEGKIKLVFRDFPLEFHRKAQKAAEAAECAKEQGRFWEMHDKLFENQEALEVESLKGYAGELGLDEEEFSSCLEGGRYEEEVKKDLEDGQRAGVTGTPAFFINGVLVSGAVSFEVLEKVIEEKLEEGVVEVETEEVEEEIGEVVEGEEEIEGIEIEVGVEEAEEIPPEEVPPEEVLPEEVVEEVVKEVGILVKKWRFDPSEVEVGLGDKVKLRLVSGDIEHRFVLGDYGIEEVVPAGGSVEVEFVADKAGSFEFKGDRDYMKGVLVVS